MDTPVIVECDRCRRPVASLHPVNEDVMPRGAPRVGALVTRLAGNNYPTPGWLLTCLGRKHPPQRRRVATATLRAAYDRATTAGTARIGLRDLRG